MQNKKVIKRSVRCPECNGLRVKLWERNAAGKRVRCPKCKGEGVITVTEEVQSYPSLRSPEANGDSRRIWFTDIKP